MSQATWKKTSNPLTPRLLRLLREAALYLLAALASYLLIVLWTYQPTDPAWSHRGPSVSVANLGGRFGAWIADVLYNLFGYTAYLFPIMIAVSGWRIYLHRRDPEIANARQRAVVWTGFLLALIGACGLASLHFGAAKAAVPPSGGWLGNIVGAGLVSAFSFTGATLFLLALFLAGVTLFAGLSWLRLMDEIGRTSILVVVKLRELGAATIDRIIGMRAKKQRRETVAVEKKILDKHTPPRIEPVVSKVPTSKRAEQEKQVPLFDLPSPGELPSLGLLDTAPKRKEGQQFSKQSLESMAKLLEKKLLDFGIEAQVVAVHPGPVITLFEIEPAPGIKASQITNLQRDLARALSVVSLRVVENIPGKTSVGLEIPNEVRETIRLSEVLASQAYDESQSPLTLALGKDISGSPMVVDLQKMPHMLIAGTTGSGKSVCINALILSLVYKSTPEQVRFIMIDPKMLELSVYEGIPHLLAPVVTDMKQAANAFKWAIAEMERRYRLMAALGVRNLAGYNRKVSDARDAKKPIYDPLFIRTAPDEEAPTLNPLPLVVIVVDELADLMMVVGKKVEELIARLAQKARASGIHLLLATQRPSVDVITGLIKANIPTRIAFQMSSRVDSRTVLDQMGAEQLLGQGDMLFLQPGQGHPTRVHGAFVADHEVHKVAAGLKKSGTPVYDQQILRDNAGVNDQGFVQDGVEGGETGGESDPLYDEALKIVTESRRASISGVQRRLRIGYNRAARLIEEMERAGVVGPLQPNGSREVIAPPPATVD